MDNYIEAQFHGKLSIDNDIDALILDPIYKDTNIEYLARQLPCRLKWHSGFKLHIDDIPNASKYTNSKYIDIARSIAKDNFLNPLILGNAISSGNYEYLAIKKIWHYMARFAYKY